MKSILALTALALLPAFQEAAPKGDFEAEVKALRAEYQKLEQDYYKQMRAAKTNEDRQKLVSPAAEYLSKFQALAEKAKGTEGGAAALLEVFGLAQRVQKKAEDARQALSTLVADHIGSPLMERVATSLRYAGQSIGEVPCQSALEAIRDKSPHDKAKAAAIFTLAVQGMKRDESASRTAFIRLQKEFAGTPYATKAEAFLFQLDHLQVGKVAPDFEATDEKGEKFKLSDFRGKVTVIDFWGFW